MVLLCSTSNPNPCCTRPKPSEQQKKRNLKFEQGCRLFSLSINIPTMDTSNSLSLLEQLDDEIDDLEESLAPIVKAALSETTSKLPLLDKAKLYVLVTYAIESILFCAFTYLSLSPFLTLSLAYLRLNGIKAREHPVFKELTRVKQYFEKIKAVENPVAKRGNLSLDKGAAARIIKAGLVSPTALPPSISDPAELEPLSY